jgi:hypothetical protein
MLGLEALGARFQRNVASLFAGFEIDPALQGLAVLVALFDKNTAAGRAFNSALHGLLDPIIAQAQNAAYVIEAFVLGFLIGATKLYIAVKPAFDAIADLLGLDTEWELADVLDIAAAAGVAFVGVVLIAIGILGALAVVLAIAVGALLLFFAPIIALSAAFYALIAAIAAGVVAIGVWIITAIDDAVGAVTGAIVAFVQIGTQIVEGIAQGITGAAGAVVSAITGVVGDAIGAAKSCSHLE